MTTEPFDIGDEPRISAEFKSDTGTLFDPSVLTVHVVPPVGDVVTYVYPDTVQKTAVGKYYIDVLATMRGRYWIYFVGSGTYGTTTEVGYFNVKRSHIPG